MARYKPRTARSSKGKKPKSQHVNIRHTINSVDVLERNAVRKHSHRGQKLNTWCTVRMQGAVEEWRKQEGGESVGETKKSIRAIARAWQIPYETLRRRIYGKVAGYGSASGRPTVLSQLVSWFLSSKYVSSRVPNDKKRHSVHCIYFC